MERNSSTNAPVTFNKFWNLVNGQLRSSSKMHQCTNPSNKTSLWNVPVATNQDLEDAVFAARTAFPLWSQTPWSKRQELLRKAYTVLESQKDNMAALITQEGGKPIQFGSLEVTHALGFLDFHSGQQSIPEKIIQDDSDLKLSLRYTPMGVVGAICPWNFPLVLAMGKIGAALITGNCIIVKPSPLTPYSILKFAELVKDIFPPGVIQALNGDNSIGPLICTHPGISKISFTGSTATGKKIMSAAAPTLKRVTLELGGNNASIVCPSVDPNIVAPQIAIGSFFNSGQLCVASKRIYVHKDIYAEFLKVMVKTVKSWKVGPVSPSATGITLGPVQNEMQYNIVREFFEDTVKNGYKFALGEQLEKNSDSLIIKPAIIENPPDESLVVTGEAFGPIVPVLTWSDENELLKRVNATTTGLGGTVWSSDIDQARRIGEKIEAGTVWINSFEKLLPQGYFAGHKESGVGGEWGEAGLLAYCNAQTIHYYKSPVAAKT